MRSVADRSCAQTSSNVVLSDSGALTKVTQEHHVVRQHRPLRHTAFQLQIRCLPRDGVLQPPALACTLCERDSFTIPARRRRTTRRSTCRGSRSARCHPSASMHLPRPRRWHRPWVPAQTERPSWRSPRTLSKLRLGTGSDISWLFCIHSALARASSFLPLAGVPGPCTHTLIPIMWRP